MSHAFDWNDLFLSAALEPDSWVGALRELANQLGSAHGQLIGVGENRDIPFNFISDASATDVQDFSKYGGDSPSHNFRIAANFRHMAVGRYDSVLYERHYDAVKPELESDICIQWCDDIDVPFGCQTNLVVDEGGLIGLALLRSRKEGRTTAQHRLAFAEAAAAARRAVRLQEKLEGHQSALLAGAFETIGATAFILDRRGQVAAMTEAAEALLLSGAIRLTNHSLDAPATPITLRQMVSALVDESGFEHIRLRVDCLNGHPPVFLEGFRLPKRLWSIGRVPHAILFAKPPRRDRAGISSFLSILYRLTATEAEVAMRLFDGKSRADICEERSITQETLRGYLKTVYAKTETHNEAGLMRLLSALMA